MSAGNLNKRITWQYSTKVSDGMGGFIITWVDACTTWSAIWPVSAAELIQTMQPVMTITHRIRIRYRSIFKASWRGKFGHRYFNIVSILNPSERCEWLDILAKEAA